MPEHLHFQPPLRDLPPRFSPALFRLLRILFPPYVRLAYRVQAIEVEGIERLTDSYESFQRGAARLLLAFRHPHVDDAPLFAYLLGKVLPDQARRRGRPLLRPPFAYFIYDRGVPLWAGFFIGWLLQRTGAMAVYRGKVERDGLEKIRKRMIEADQPIAIAPEGGVTYREHVVAPLELGVAHFAFWCARDLAQRGRKESVCVLPLAIAYRHAPRARRELVKLIAKIERELGLPTGAAQGLAGRLESAAEALLGVMEQTYARYYRSRRSGGAKGGAGRLSAEGIPETERIERVIDAALRAAEERFGLPSEGGQIPRMRRVEQAAWDRIYRPDLKRSKNLPVIVRSIADRVALEASVALRHLQLVDVLVYLQDGLTAGIGNGAPELDALIECATNLAALLSRLMGNDIAKHPRLGPRRVRVSVGEPIEVTSRLVAYRSNRQAAVEELRGSIASEFVRLSGASE